MSTAEREQIKRLVDLVPDEDLSAAKRMLHGLARDPVAATFESAPLDEEGELSEEMMAKLAKADQAIAEGRIVSHEEARRRSGL